MIYKDEKGQKYLALSDEDLENLDWNPKKLLEPRFEIANFRRAQFLLYRIPS